MFGCHFKTDDDLANNVGSMLVVGVSADLTVAGSDFGGLKGSGKIKYFYEFEESYWNDEEPPKYKLQALGAPNAQGELIATYSLSQYDEARYVHIRDG
jgi:hypothetical protein